MGRVRIINNSKKPEWQGYGFLCPGCNEYHMVDNSWQFNGDLDHPTFHPSILVNRKKLNPAVPICHSFITAGNIQFLSDSTHKLAGRTVDLPSITALEGGDNDE